MQMTTIYLLAANLSIIILEKKIFFGQFEEP